jgi:hypothetical protein
MITQTILLGSHNPVAIDSVKAIKSFQVVKAKAIFDSL